MLVCLVTAHLQMNIVIMQQMAKRMPWACTTCRWSHHGHYYDVGHFAYSRKQYFFLDGMCYLYSNSVHEELNVQCFAAITGNYLPQERIVTLFVIA